MGTLIVREMEVIRPLAPPPDSDVKRLSTHAVKAWIKQGGATTPADVASRDQPTCLTLPGLPMASTARISTMCRRITITVNSRDGAARCCRFLLLETVCCASVLNVMTSRGAGGSRLLAPRSGHHVLC